MRKLLLVIGLLAAVASPAAAQVPDSVPLTPEQRALARLRALGRVAEPDSLRTDSLRADSISIRQREGGQPAGPPPSPITRDSIMERLLGLRGYLGTEYAGGTARFEADSNRLQLRLNPQVSREGNQLVADSVITYDERRAEACGYGSPILHAADMTNPLQSDTVCYNVERRIGYARGARTQLDQGAQWFVRGDVYVSGDDYYSHDAIFTDCNEPWPHYHYHFAASELKIDRTSNILVARNVTMNFADVPVFWLPFMMQSMSRGRRSGILMPRFGINDIARTSSRYSRRIEDVGVYWAISEHFGSELAMDWFANNWTALRGSLDYNFTDRFLRGGVTYRKFWKQEGGSDFTIATDNSWEPDERTRIGINGEYTTSTEFVRQRTFDPREVNRNIASFGSLRRTFDWGGVSLGVSRRQQLSDNTVTTVLPNVDVTFSPITLFEALPGEERFYSNLTWSGSATSRIEHRGIDLALAPNSMQAGRATTAGGNSRFNIGDLGLQQQFNYNEQRRDEREVLQDDSTMKTLPGVRDQRGTWSANIDYVQRLVGNTRLTPRLSMDGEFVSNEASEFRTVTAPLRTRLGAALSTEIYGFWPGAGPFERLRHKISPSLSYEYSPEAKADSIQRAVFSGAGVAEQNRISFGFSQTFEAKYKSRPEDDEAEAGTRGEQEAADSLQGGPRRRQQAAVINLLSISTEAIGYDFVQARERGDGITTATLTNTIQSDLLRGLQLSITHDLFRSTAEEGTGGSPLDGPIQREFAPHLSSLNTGFSLNGGSWLFRLLRLGSGDTVPNDRSAAPMQAGNPMAAGPAVDRTESEYGMVGTSRRTAPGAPRGAVGSWNASFQYTLARSREEVPNGRNEQMVNGNFTFQPTENWAVTWTTGYTFEKSQFTDHVLTLSRTLHDWDANFDFVKAQNGNFSFQFRVHLRANPDIKLDYSQSDAQAVRRSTSAPF